MRRPLVFALLLVLASPVFAQDLKDKAALDAQWKTLGRQIADKHFDLAKSLEKAGLPREAVEELALAILADPDNKHAREKLGYKKEGDVWRGYPQVPPATDKKPDETLAKTREKTHEESAKKISALAKRAKGSLPDDARRLAGIACDFKTDDKVAREILGGESRRGAWVSPREIKIEEAFAKACDAAGAGGTEKKNEDDDAIAKFLDVGELKRRETPRQTVILSSKAVTEDLAPQAKIADATWDAYRYFLAGDTQGFSVDGETKREITGEGAPKAPPFGPRIIFLEPGSPTSGPSSSKEHVSWCEKVWKEKGLQAANKTCGGTANFVNAGGKNIWCYEGCYVPRLRSEWVSAQIASWMAVAVVPEKAHFPDFLLEGLRRFFSGHASGRVDIVYVSFGTTGGKQEFKPAEFSDYRGTVRPTLLLSFEGDLRSLFSRGQNDLAYGDTVKAFAFVDFCIARHRSELGAFLAQLKPEELPVKTFETAFKASLDEIEREFRDWAREEY